MKEIKYRAWLKKENKMVEVVDIAFKHKIIGYVENHLYSDTTFEDVELMQFTGLYDDNGKPIYEGDIIGIGCNFFVKYSLPEGAFRLCDLEEECIIWFDALEGRRIKVIGNIYENKELLVKTKKTNNLIVIEDKYREATVENGLPYSIKNGVITLNDRMFVKPKNKEKEE